MDGSGSRHAGGVKEKLAQLLRAELGRDDAEELANTLLFSNYAPCKAADQPHLASMESRACDWDASALSELARTGTISDAQAAAFGGTSSSSSSGEGMAVKLNAAKNDRGPDQRIMVYRDDGRQVRWFRDAAEALAAIKGDGEGWFWMDITEATAEETEQVGKRLQLHPLTVEDIQEGAMGRDKVERMAENHYVLLTYRLLGPLAEEPFAVVLSSHNWAVTFHGEEGGREVGMRMLDRMANEQAGSGLGLNEFLAFAAVDEVTDAMTRVAVEMEGAAARLDSLVMQQPTAASNEYYAEKHKLLQQLGLLRRRLLLLWRLVMDKPEIVRCLQHRELPMAHLLLRDVSDHVKGLCSLCSQVETVLSRAHANLMAQLSLKANRDTHGAGLVSSRWLVLVGLMLPMQLVTLVFGQNIVVPWMYDEESGTFDTLAPWLGIMGCILAVFALGLAAAWHRNYLKV
ncbi:hypothetical protein IWW36_002327 [Coemansia brasiliensis]|uniref:Uncharacterized protein n=1 Tax=Coemansia brasiliensis TaxID=2650707 RepID=A0A9W8IC73_9FUNG|nr:hypothetical protein IWW36_002327 [Coemansia brasiliensis]